MLKTRGGDDRRIDDRIRNEVLCPVAFKADGRNVCGYLVDLSRTGARFKIFDTERAVSIHPDMEHEYTIYTNYGDSLCRARTMWVERTNGDYLWGVKFVELPGDHEDPLRRILQALP